MRAGEPRYWRPGVWLLALVTAACGDTVSAPPPGDGNDPPVCTGDLCDRARLDALGLDPFYRKFLDAEGIPVVGSHRVPDAALRRAGDVVQQMLADRPDVRDSMIANGARVAIMARTEVTTDIPEHAFLANDPNVDWDTRARGLGGTVAVPVTSGAEENLLCLAEDVYRGENILVHELAHGIQALGIEFVDPGFVGTLRVIYDSAMAEGRWEGTYAETNPHEYWAEGVQSWYDANQAPQPGIHNEVDTRVELRSYDPRLASLIEAWFPDVGWRPTCPAGAGIR